MKKFEKVGQLHKQGTCKVCRISCFGYKRVSRDLCGNCLDPETGNRHPYLEGRRVNDDVAKVPEIDAVRETMILDNQIDSLKREVNYWKNKYNEVTG